MSADLFEIGAGPRSLRELHLPRPLQVAVIAPHPDDFDAIGATLRHLHMQGHAIEVAVMTNGANGVDGEASTEEKTALREEEQRASCAFFGLPPGRLHFLRLWEQADEDELAGLRAWMAGRRPDLLFLPHGNDSNRTHRRTFEAVRAVAAEQGLNAWACLNQDAKTADMRVDLFCGFDQEEADWKACLLRCHRSQQERNLRTRGTGFDERVLQVNRGAAQALGSALPYAEVFELLRLGPAQEPARAASHTAS
ncbi:PIG-L family deacetylase [Ramlibacter agri]|uniref:PIG-L deacetylase family protein n=1 Tax=Ramlibacter agri TaxID=2728837 RepID=UPI003159F1B9